MELSEELTDVLWDKAQPQPPQYDYLGLRHMYDYRLYTVQDAILAAVLGVEVGHTFRLRKAVPLMEYLFSHRNRGT